MADARLAQRSQGLNADDLMKAAQEATGLTDFGRDLAFREGLDVLIHGTNKMSDYPIAIGHVRDRVVNFLTMRLRLVDDEKHHPEIGHIPIEAPLIITGLPRTGTTIIFDLLALDRRFRYPRDWEWFMPWPATEAETIETDPRIALLQPAFEQALTLDPALAAVHRFDCREPGECNSGMMYHFAGSNYWAELAVPDHAQWVIDVVPEGLYRDHKRLLQQMSWKGPQGRWLLKSPHHLFDLPGLFRTYPDACLIWTHRDPVKCFSSLASLVSKIRPGTGLPVDPVGVGRMAAQIWGTALLKALDARRRHPELDARIIDLSHAEIAEHPMRCIETIYARLGDRLTPNLETQILQFLAHHKGAQRLGKHTHDPSDFGIDTDQQHQILGVYYSEFSAMI